MTSIAVTEKASQQIRQLGGDQKFLRIWVTQGGCSGMVYEASLDENQTPFDVVVYETDGVRILSDRNSSAYLEGLNVDYSEDLISLGFRFSNHNAKKSCGCGASFAV
jgi:iron-sulfur cluster assembly protein